MSDQFCRRAGDARPDSAVMSPRGLRNGLILGALLWALILAPFAIAQDVHTFTWQPPTERTDGQPIASGELLQYRIRCNDVTVRTFAPPATNSIGVELAPGDYVCQLRVRSAAGWSAWSNRATFTIAAQLTPPRAPTGFTFAR